MTAFTIRDARESDLELLNAYAEAEGIDTLSSPARVRVAADADDTPVGFCRLQSDKQGNEYVNPIVVLDTWRGTGVGRALIMDARDAVGELRLVSRGEVAGFYRKLGFTELPWESVDLVAASEHCDDCPVRDECGPVPMRLAAK